MKPKIILSSIATIIIAIVFPPNIFGQNTKISLSDCIQIALDNNLTMKSGRILIEKAKDLEGTAFNIDKTNFSLSQDPTSGGSPDNSISLNQSFEFPTIYGSRKRLLKAETNLERSNLEVTRNELVKEISAIYYRLLYGKETIRILQQQDSIYSKFLFLANAKLNSGEAGKLEQMNAERIYNENKIELHKAEKNYQNMQLILRQWLKTEQFIEPVESRLAALETNYPFKEFEPEQNPLGEVYENKKIITEKNLSVIKQGYLPSFSFALKNQFLIKGFNPYDIQRKRFDKGSFMGFEVGISIPLFFGEQRARTKAAKREVEIARIQKEEAMLTIHTSYQTYLNEYKKAKNALDYYSLRGNKQAADMMRISQISYENGEINYIEYIQNLKTAAEIHLQYANAINEYNQTIIMLNYLQGNK